MYILVSHLQYKNYWSRVYRGGGFLGFQETPFDGRTISINNQSQ